MLQCLTWFANSACSFFADHNVWQHWYNWLVNMCFGHRLWQLGKAAKSDRVPPGLSALTCGKAVCEASLTQESIEATKPSRTHVSVSAGTEQCRGVRPIPHHRFTKCGLRPFALTCHFTW